MPLNFAKLYGYTLLNESSGNMTLTIEEHRVKDFEKFVEMYNRKARRFGTTEINAKKSPARQTTKNKTVDIIGYDGTDTSSEYDIPTTVYDYTLNVDDLKVLNGWEFAATIDVLENGSTVHKSPNFKEPIPQRFYQKQDNSCEHCNTKRQRKNCYLLYNRSERQWKIVGRSCLKDFLGHSPAAFEFVENQFQQIFEFEKEGSAMRSEPMVVVRDFLKAAYAVVKTYGFVPSSSEYNEPTKNKVSYYFYTDRIEPDDRDTQEQLRNLAESDEAEVAVNAMVAQAREGNAESDYAQNVKTLLGNKVAPLRRSAGILASVPKVFAPRPPKDERTSSYVGQVKERLRGLELTVTRNITLPDYGYGESSLILMKDEETGDVFKWKSSRPYDLDEGDVLTLDGTVKSHDEYKDIKQTVLTRAKVHEIKPADA